MTTSSSDAQRQTSSIAARQRQPLLIAFTTVPSITDSNDWNTTHSTTFAAWSRLLPVVQPVLFVVESQRSQPWITAAKRHGFLILNVPTLRNGAPILRDMFLRIEQMRQRPVFVAYFKHDVLFSYDLIETLMLVNNQRRAENLTRGVLLVGQRSPVLIRSRKHGAASHSDDVTCVPLKLAILARNGYDVNSLDYFITFRNMFPWQRVPDLVVNTPGYEEWLVAMAAIWNVSVIDASQGVTALHYVTPKSRSNLNWLSPTSCDNYDITDSFKYSSLTPQCATWYVTTRFQQNCFQNCLSVESRSANMNECTDVSRRLEVTLASTLFRIFPRVSTMSNCELIARQQKAKVQWLV